MFECVRRKFGVTIWLNLRLARWTGQNTLSCSDASVRRSPNLPRPIVRYLAGFFIVLTSDLECQRKRPCAAVAAGTDVEAYREGAALTL